MKLPSMQFYPADWRKDPGVQALSYHDRGVWFEILCLMHESEQRGKLILNGNPMPEDALARLLGLDNQTLNQTLTTILTYGVATREPESGVLICRRMVRDEGIRKIRQDAGKMGGNPLLLNQNGNQKPTTRVKQKSTPSSSSSSSDKNTPSEHSGNSGEASLSKKSRQPNPFYEEFQSAYFRLANCPYVSKQADFIQLAKCKSELADWLTNDRWKIAVRNYFLSEIGEHTLADLSVRFSVFFKSPLDRFKQPITGNGYAKPETERRVVV